MQGRLALPVVDQYAVARQQPELVLPTRRSATDCWLALQRRHAAMCAARPSLVLQQPDARAPLGPWPPLPLLNYLPMLMSEPVRGMTRLPRPSQLLCWMAVQRWQPRAQAAAPERAPATLTILQYTTAHYSWFTVWPADFANAVGMQERVLAPLPQARHGTGCAVRHGGSLSGSQAFRREPCRALCSCRYCQHRRCCWHCPPRRAALGALPRGGVVLDCPPLLPPVPTPPLGCRTRTHFQPGTIAST